MPQVKEGGVAKLVLLILRDFDKKKNKSREYALESLVSDLKRLSGIRPVVEGGVYDG